MRMAIGERGAGPAVVLVHGLFATGADWDLVASDLARDHRVIQPDLIGFGASDRTGDGEALWADAQARALADTLDESTLLPHGSLCLLEEAGHFMPRHHPDDLARALRELLARSPAPSVSG